VGWRGDAALAVTYLLLRRLSSRALVGVLAPEVSHIGADDVRIMNLTETVGS
jgi:Zn-dependent protease with chaperone function